MVSKRHIPLSPPDCYLDRMEQVRFEPWESIRRQGSQADFFYFARQGVIGEFRVLKNSKQILVSKVNNGDFFGRSELLNHVQGSASYVALNNTILYRGDEEDLRYCRQNFDLSTGWDDSSNRLRKNYHEKIDQLLSLKLEERMALELCDLAGHLGRRVVDGIEITTPMTRNNLSNILGCALETVSRIISEWTKNQILATEKKIITLLRPEKLMVKTPEQYTTPELELSSF